MFSIRSKEKRDEMHIIPLPLGGDGAGNGEDDPSSMKTLEVDLAGAAGFGHELAKLRRGAVGSPPKRSVDSSCCNMGTAAE